ncbi:MAG TPA: YjdF family protein [Bacteroidales bacterium]|nr:YjdF family protein [Bacteroidales bacterium]
MYSKGEISVLFEEPFWIVLFEKEDEYGYAVAREIIGASEPTGAELAAFLENINIDNLRFTLPLITQQKHGNFKRANYKLQMRKAKHIQETSKYKYTFTKAQTMLKEHQSIQKEERKKFSRQEKEKDLERKFELKQIKRKEKHRGH